MKKSLYTPIRHLVTLTLLPGMILLLCNTLKAQVSVTATMGTPGPTSYTDLSSAFAAVDSGTHQGDIVVEISASFVDANIAVLNSSGSGSALYTSVTVRPVNDGIIAGFATPAGRGMIELNGADSVTIDGDNPNTPGISRNLTFTNSAANTVTFTSVIRIATSATAPFDNANSITIKNLAINGSATGRNISGATSTTGTENNTFGIVAGPEGGTTVNPLSNVTSGMATGAVVNNFTVENCGITHCARAIAFLGSSTSSSTGVNITGNLIGDQSAVLSGIPPFLSPSGTVYTKGIFIQGTNAVNITGNSIKNIISYVGTNISAVELSANIGSGTINISNNTIEGIVLNSNNTSGARGIYVAGSAGVYTISNNTITHIESNSGTSTNQPSGIEVNTAAPSALIENNRITKVYNRNISSWGVNGIVQRGGSNVTISNNMVADINQDMRTTGSFGIIYSVYGIKISAGSGHVVQHNSVNLFGSTLGPSVAGQQSSFAFCITASTITGCDVRNNIFANTLSGGHATSIAHTAIFLPTATGAMNLTLNNNAYFCGTNDSMQGVAQVGVTAGSGMYRHVSFNTSVTTPAGNLRAYTSLLNSAGNNDSASMSFNTAPPFISNTDLHVAAGTATGFESTGAVSGITTDIDGDARPGPAGSVNGGALAPDIGADEGDFIPVNYFVDSTVVDQTVGSVLPNTNDQVVLRLRVYVSGFLNPLTLSSLKLNTAGSTSAADITNAHVYYTGAGSTFSTSMPFGSPIPGPAGTFYATGSQTLIKGVNYFWVTYDVSAGAGLLNVLDATLDSLLISGANYAPVNGNPAGNILITNPMSYISSTTTQTNTNKVGQGTTNNVIIGIEVNMSATGTPVNVTQLDFDATGTTDTANIKNIKVWYTGGNNTFAATMQVGPTLAKLPGGLSFNITGTLPLTNGANYFWLTYDIDSLAAVGNLVDAECTAITVDGVTQLPSVTAPVGSREIRVEYCPGPYTYSCSNGDFVNNFSTTGAVNDISYLLTGCNNISNSYNYYQSQTIVASKASSFTIHYQGSGAWPEGFKIWIDYNQDGIFGTSELVASAPATDIMNHSVVIIPCDALPGTTRLRIRNVYNALPATACSQEAYGETEDYNITILDNPVHYSSSTAVQQTGLVAPNDIDKPVLRIPVRASGCGDAVVTSFSFNTAASTNAANDIATAKLYATGNSATFNTDRLIGTVSAPNGPFSFTVNDTLNNNDTTHYWLAYDLSLGATVSNVIDARIDSIEILGTYRIPTVGDPAGTIGIDLPMTYISSNTTQDITSKVAQGSTNNQVLKLEVVTSATGAPVNLIDITFNAAGTTDTANIRNIKVWYTGSSGAFATTLQYGSTLPVLPGTLAFVVTGNQSLANGSNYFWLTYDIDPAAAVGNAVDGECNGITIGGMTQTPATVAPAGSRQIRTPYCIPTQTGTALIKNVTFNTLHYSAPTGAAPFYRSFAAQDSATTSMASSITYNLSVTTATNASISVWIDYNDDGIFAASEWLQVASTSTANVASVVPVTIPCGTATGEIRMRVRTRTAAAANGPTDACTAFGGGETQDYAITLTNTPASYTYSTAVQQTGNVAPGTGDVSILRVPVRIDGCGVTTLTMINLNTTGSTNAGDIASAKLYVTGNSPVFAATKQVGSTVFSPGISFFFTPDDTLLNNDTTNYWIVYDVSPGAVMGNVLDAAVDSMEIQGSWHIPANGNPAGNLLVDAPMTYISSTTTQTITTRIGQGTPDNQVIGIEVVTSATGSVAYATQFDFNTNGTTDTSDIRNIKLWYTGSSNAFATATQVGTTLPFLPGSTLFSITGSQGLVNGINYFWLSYDIDPGSAIGNVIDAECASMIIDAAMYVPGVTAPAGSREIRADYCTPPYSTGCGDGDFVNNFSTAGGITNISNMASGCNPNPNSFIYYTSQTVTVNRGGMFTVNYRGSGDWPEAHKIWIDYNHDGFFTDNEEVAASAPTTAASSSVVIVPLTASEGVTRMRIRNVYNAFPDSACSPETWGETEDYNVNILPAPFPATYTWNKTTPDTFGIAANWTPARILPNLNDILVFNAGVPVTVRSANNQIMSGMIIDNNTTVMFEAPGSGVMTITDSLQLLSGKVVTGSNLTLSLGTGVMATGILTGTGTIEGAFRRWVGTSVASYAMPLAVGANNRNATIAFTTAPATGGTLTARFINGTTTSGGLPLTEGSINVNKLCLTGYWSVIAADGLSGGTYDIAVTAEGFTGISNYSDLVLVKRSSNVLPWLLSGTHVITGGSNAVPVLSRTGVTGFSEFAVGGDSTVNPLPVKLLDFTARKISDDVLLSWSTAGEINNKGFTLERVNVKGGWEEIGFVKGKGTTSLVSNYRYNDPSPFMSLPAPLFYRLRQTDFNGAFVYSHVVSVSDKPENKPAISCYPNPFVSELTIAIQSSENTVSHTEISDLSGKILLRTQFMVYKGSNQFVLREVAALKPGIYIVKVVTGKETINQKLTKSE